MTLREELGTWGKLEKRTKEVGEEKGGKGRRGRKQEGREEESGRKKSREEGGEPKKVKSS